MEVYWWGAGVVMAAGLVLGVVLWRGGMPFSRYQGGRFAPDDVVGVVALAACLATVWPLLVPFALRALWRWMWKSAAPPGGHDPGR